MSLPSRRSAERLTADCFAASKAVCPIFLTKGLEKKLLPALKPSLAIGAIPRAKAEKIDPRPLPL